MKDAFTSEKNIARFLYIADVVILVASLGALFFHNLFGHPGYLIWSGSFALAATAYYLTSFKNLYGKSRYATSIQFLLNAGVVYAVMLATGGFSSALFPVYFFLLIALSIYAVYGSVVIAAAGAGLVVFTTGSPAALLSGPAVQFYLLIPLGVVVGRELNNLREERKRAAFLAEHMTEEKSRDEALLSSIADAVYAVDKERRIIMWNAAAEQLTGFNATETLGLRDHDLIDLRDGKGKKICPGSTCPIDQTWATNIPVRRDDIYMLSKERKSIVLNYNAAPIRDLHNVVTGAVVIFQDITRRKEVERMRNEFVSVASHEMRTPIAAIEGYISLAQKVGEGTLTPKVAEYLEKAHTSVVFSGNLLKNLLLVSKIDEDAVPVMPTEFELGGALDDVITTMTPAAAAKGLELENELSSISSEGRKVVSTPFTIRADKERIKEVVANLIENSIKFTKTGYIRTTVSGDNNFVTLCVEDTGPGIPAEEIPKLFRKFYRIDNTFTREVGGTGLGLYIARSIIELSGGKIWAENRDEGGARFCFTLPRVG